MDYYNPRNLLYDNYKVETQFKLTQNNAIEWWYIIYNHSGYLYTSNPHSNCASLS